MNSTCLISCHLNEVGKGSLVPRVLSYSASVATLGTRLGEELCNRICVVIKSLNAGILETGVKCLIVTGL